VNIRNFANIFEIVAQFLENFQGLYAIGPAGIAVPHTMF